MAVQLIESFAGKHTGLITSGPSGGANFNEASTPGPWSLASYQVGVSNEWLGFKDQTGTRFFVAMRVYISNFNKNIGGIFNPSLGLHAYWDVSSTGFLRLRDAAGTIVGTGTTALFQSAWNLVEIDVAIGNSAAASAWVHGLSTADISVSGQDFQNGSETTGAFLFIGANTGNRLADIIVYDSSGANWNSRVGDKVIQVQFPNAKGDQEQWDPKKTGSVNRFYFPKATRNYDGPKDGYPAPVLPAFAASWEYTDSVSATEPPRGRLTPEKYATSSPANGVTDSNPDFDVSGSAPWDILGAQYVSPALAAQTISGTVTMQMIVDEEVTGDNIASQLVIRAVSNDGQTVIGTLYAGDTDATNPPSSEWSTSATSRKFPRAALSPITLSSLAISEGDRLVIEFGGRMRGAARSSVLMQYVTGANGSTDLPVDETDTTTTKNPWIEFNTAVSLSDDGNWDHLKDTPPDDDGTYVSTSTDDDLDEYHLDAVSSALTVSGPMVIKTRAKKNDPGVRTITHGYETSGAVQLSAALPVTVGSYVYQRSYHDIDATDSAVFSDSKMATLQLAIKATT